ncbi:hypothetical protein GCM10010271_68180 [Streptomyces kurssanovii]|nr:hypothetical protein GCM10010271_68180 [Streptomyces kurssanovii]
MTTYPRWWGSLGADGGERRESQLSSEFARAEPPVDVARLYVSVESWRRAAVAETRRIASEEAYGRVVGEMRREGLAAIDAKGAAFQPVEWEESTRIFRVQGVWTVTVSVCGTDHTAVREAFAAGLGRREEILADAQKRIPRVSGTVRAAADDTPERVRKAWRRDRRWGTAPKPATGCHSPGSWVTWQHPETGRTLTGIVTKWLLGEDRPGPPHGDPLGRRRAGGDGAGAPGEAHGRPVECRLRPGDVQPGATGAEQLELV